LKHLRSARHRALCAVIIEAREAAGLTQRQLAARLKRSQPWVTYIETGQRRLDVLEFIEIAHALRVDAQQLFAKLAGRPALDRWRTARRGSK